MPLRGTVASSTKARVAARMRAARRAAGLSQQALADRLGIRRAAVTQWESAEGTLPSTINLMQAAIETKVAFEWLATGRGPMHLGDADGAAFSVDCVAQSFDEETLLALFRRCSVQQRDAVIAFLTATTADKGRTRR